MYLPPDKIEICRVNVSAKIRGGGRVPHLPSNTNGPVVAWKKLRLFFYLSHRILNDLSTVLLDVKISDEKGCVITESKCSDRFRFQIHLKSNNQNNFFFVKSCRRNPKSKKYVCTVVDEQSLD